MESTKESMVVQGVIAEVGLNSCIDMVDYNIALKWFNCEMEIKLDDNLKFETDLNGRHFTKYANLLLTPFKDCMVYLPIDLYIIFNR